MTKKVQISTKMIPKPPKPPKPPRPPEIIFLKFHGGLKPPQKPPTARFRIRNRHPSSASDPKIYQNCDFCSKIQIQDGISMPRQIFLRGWNTRPLKPAPSMWNGPCYEAQTLFVLFINSFKPMFAQPEHALIIIFVFKIRSRSCLPAHHSRWIWLAESY